MTKRQDELTKSRIKPLLDSSGYENGTESINWQPVQDHDWTPAFVRTMFRVGGLVLAAGVIYRIGLYIAGV